MKKILLSLALFGNATFVWACSCGSSHIISGGASGAVYTVSGDTMSQGDFYLGFSAESTHNDALSDAIILSETESGSGHIHGIDTIHTYTTSLSYGITNDLTVNLLIPYTQTLNIRAGELDDIAEVHQHRDVKGFGDISTIFQYKIFHDKKSKISILGGVKFPIGKDDVQDADEVLELDLQPGSGSFDYYAGIAYSENFNHLSFHANLLYKYTTEGSRNSELGNALSYNIALTYTILEQDHYHPFLEHNHEDHKDHLEYSLGTFLELNGEHLEKNKEDSIVVENTGGDIIYVTSGLQFSFLETYSAFIAISLPVYENYIGVQNENNYKINVGFGASF